MLHNLLQDPAAFWLMLIAVALASFAAVRFVLALLHHHDVLDVPNERSQHAHPTPRGGGWGILLVILPLWAWLGWDIAAINGIHLPLMMGLALMLALIGWWDDCRDVPAGIRLLAQAGIALIITLSVPYDTIIVTDWWPRWLEHGLLFLGIIWFINLHNFMDGADGLLASHVVCFTLSLAFFLWQVSAPIELIFRSAALGFAVMGFLWWNKPVAEVFAGDVGSTVLGLLVAILIIESTAYLHAAAIMTLTLYFVMDATITLINRVRKGHHPFTPHREHFFQKYLQTGHTSARLLSQVWALNAALLIYLNFMRVEPWWAFIGALPLVGMMLYQWHRDYERYTARQKEHQSYRAV